MRTKSNYSYTRNQSKGELATLITQWRQGLDSPPDGMWESFRESAVHWGINYQGELVGYACVNDDQQLIQFYLVLEHVGRGELVLGEFLRVAAVASGIVGTNNPVYLALALDHAKSVAVDTYLFRDLTRIHVEEKAGTLHACTAAELGRLVDFYHASMDASKVWLTEYLGKRVAQGEVFYLKHKGVFAGACEVRKSATDKDVADIGMVVSPDYRRRGYGAFLAHQAKEIALSWGCRPICSCERDNAGSYGALTKAGFVSRYRLLAIDFKD